MRFSIICITNNRVELLKHTLHSLNLQTFTDFEMVIVDDGSNAYIIEDQIDSSDFNFAIVHHRNPGKSGCSKARNDGIAKAQGEILIFIDSGMILTLEYLELYNKRYNELNRNHAISGYSYYLPEGSMPKNYDIAVYINEINNKNIPVEECEVRKWYNIVGKDKQWKCFIGNNCSCYREDALEISGFNECFKKWGPDDIEFAYRLQKRLGRKILMFKDLISYHLWHPVADEQKKMENFLTTNKVFTEQHPEVKWSGILPIKHYKKYLEYANVVVSDEYAQMLEEIES